MALRSIYDLYKTMEKDNTILSFKGIVTADLLTSVLQIMESKLESIEKSTKTKKKVYNVLVECLQNLYHHNEHLNLETEDENYFFSKSALLLISKQANSYAVKTGNYIDINKVDNLKNKLDTINQMNRAELREYYKSILKDGERSDKGTAGLGMIDIARKSGNKLEYEFLHVDNEVKFFCLNVRID